MVTRGPGRDCIAPEVSPLSFYALAMQCPLSSSAFAMQCPLILRIHYAPSPYSPMQPPPALLRIRYATPPAVLRICYAARY
eukprot:1516612-Rhodomonas_salina.1